jgi:hypothetical protein
MSTSADNLDLLSSDKLASAIANSGEKIASVIAAADEFQREAARLQSRAIHPFFLGAAPVPLPRRRRWLVVMGAIVMLMVAVVVGIVAVRQWSFPALWQHAGDRSVEFASSRAFRVAAPRLLVQASPATSGEPAPLGLAVQGRADDAVVMITGLVPGMSLSTGSQIGIDTWRIPTAALPSTWIGPPTNFVGVVDLVAELHLADMTITDRRSIKLEWGAAITAAAAASPTVETDRTAVAPPREQNVARQLDADEATVETDRAELHRADMTIADRLPIKFGWGGAILAAAAANPRSETDGTAAAPPREQTAAPPLQRGIDDPTVETDRTAAVSPLRQPGADDPMVETGPTAVEPPREQTAAAPPLQLDIDEPTVEADRTDRTAVAPAAASPNVETDRTAGAPPQEQNVAASRQLDVDEIAALLKHGENLIRNGDLAAARLVLQRASEAKSAEAALTLGATYDPVILRELRVYGFASDVEMARSWYEKAKEFGSAAASQRLEILTRRPIP